MLLHCVVYVFAHHDIEMPLVVSIMFGNTVRENRLQKEEGKKYDETAPKGQQIKQDLP